MNYTDEYKKKLTSAEDAVRVVKSGDWVNYAWCVNAPYYLDKALAERKDELTDVKVRNGVTMWMPEIMKADDAAEHFTWHSWHCTGIDRKIIESGKGFFIPQKFSELPTYFRDGYCYSDVTMIQVTPMNTDGYFSYGLSPAHIYELIRASKTVIVEVNEEMPWIYGDETSVVHIDDVDMIVEGAPHPVAELGDTAPATDVDRTVADLVVKEIPNGACLQLGIGTMPSTIGSLIAKSDLRDMSVHTEMYVDGFADIGKAGKLTGKYKKLCDGKQAFSFAAGHKYMYDYMAENPDIFATAVDRTNGVAYVSQIDNFISINNAVEIDLFSQVNGESVGSRQISGTGGQLDFVQGAYLSKGGKSFICLSSTMKDKNGNIKSRIVPTLNPGSIVTTPRTCMHYFVTEYGMVCLMGASTWERTEKIIGIAHPDFRDSLISEAERLHIWRRSNKR